MQFCSCIWTEFSGDRFAKKSGFAYVKSGLELLSPVGNSGPIQPARPPPMWTFGLILHVIALGVKYWHAWVIIIVDCMHKIIFFAHDRSYIFIIYTEMKYYKKYWCGRSKSKTTEIIKLNLDHGGKKIAGNFLYHISSLWEKFRLLWAGLLWVCWATGNHENSWSCWKASSWSRRKCSSVSPRRGARRQIRHRVHQQDMSSWIFSWRLLWAEGPWERSELSPLERNIDVGSLRAAACEGFEHLSGQNCRDASTHFNFHSILTLKFPSDKRSVAKKKYAHFKIHEIRFWRITLKNCVTQCCWCLTHTKGWNSN